MGDKTGIEWTEATWNPVVGCSRVSVGCVNCYAEGEAKRNAGPGKVYEGLLHASGAWNGTVRFLADRLDQPVRWGRARRIFVNSMSDVFHEALSFEHIAAIFGVMAVCERHTFQLLTKRAERMVEFFQWLDRQASHPVGKIIACMKAAERQNPAVFKHAEKNLSCWPLPNVWVGVSVEDQSAADTRIPLLLQCPAAVRWLSCEPLIGPVDLTGRVIARAAGEVSSTQNAGVDWVVVGGESGPRARPMHPGWATSLRNQCQQAGVPFLFKQWGEWVPALAGMWFHPMTDGPAFAPCAAGRNTYEFGDGLGAVRIGKRKAGRALDGIEHNGYPPAAMP